MVAPAASPWPKAEAEEMASRAVVIFLHHTRPGRDDWLATEAIMEAVEEVWNERQLMWLVTHSVSDNRGPRLIAKTTEDGVLKLRATPAARAAEYHRTPWERGARLDSTGARARGPRSEHAQIRRQALLKLRRSGRS